MLALLAIRARIAGAPAPAHGPLYEGAVYTGALLGVRARVELGVDRDFAEVALSGLPSAARCAAARRLESLESPLDDALARAMRRRCCAITAVTPSATATPRVSPHSRCLAVAPWSCGV